MTAIKTYHVQDDERWQQLFDQLRFEYVYSVHRLVHCSGLAFKNDLTVIDYSDEYFEEKIQLESEAFEEVRRANNITPYNWYTGASEKGIASLREMTRNNSDYIKLYKSGDVLVGASQVKEREIELIFTAKAFQGKGYGSQILRDAIVRGQQQGNGEVFLNVIAQNEKALKLYLDNQFRLVQSQDCRRISI